jgi:hypothetical protein
LKSAHLLLLLATLAGLNGCGKGPPEGAGSTFRSAHFTGSGSCAGCHDGLTDAKGQDVSIAADWAPTMMGNSARDPFWQAKVASELRRNPALASVINEKCTRCHAPMASVEAASSGTPIEVFGQGVLDPKNPLHEVALEGASCTLCHQIQNSSKLGTLDGFSGKYTIGTYPKAVDRPLFGQYPGPRVAPMQNNVQYTPTHGPHIQSSELCASCHNLKTPFVDASGKVVSTTPESEFPEQMVYSEWLNSDFSGPDGKSCAACHLPRTDGVRISTRPDNLAARDGFGRHWLVGGNTMMLDLLDRNREALSVTATGFDVTIARTRETLASAASLAVVSATRENSTLNLALRIENRSGHKLPTSYPSRRVWLHVLVKDPAGAVLFESGRMQQDGSIVGVDADTSLSTFEPHHEVITSAEQVQVYESIMGDTDGLVTYTLLRGAAYLKDNRLLPRGFPKGSAPDDVAVVGGAAADPDFLGGGDVVTYRVPVTPAALSILVELRYQSMAHGFLQDLFLDASDPAVARFQDLYRTAPLRAETIASLSAQIP